VVFFVAYPHVYGGVERELELVAPALQQRGWAVSVVLPGDGIAAERFRSGGLDVDVVAAPPSLRVYGRATRGSRAAAAAAALPGYWSKLRRRLGQAEVVHTFEQRGALLAAPSARLARVPLVWHVGASDPGRLLNPMVARLASAVIAVSPSAARGLPASRVVIVPNAVHPHAFDAQTRPASDAFDVACAARLTPEKGIDVLVRATAILRRDLPDTRVLVLGAAQEGHEEYEADLVGLAAELGVSDSLCFQGFVDEPFRYWAGARVYVQPSRREGFGLAIAEAMASGLPVVATAVGGVPELLEGGKAGRLIPPNDPDALAAAISDLLRDPVEAARLAKAGRARVEAQYTVDRMVDGVEAVYRSLLA